MRTIAPIVLQFAWALWLGGLFTVFLSVLTLFHNDRSVAVQAAPQIFHAFEPYQCGLAAVTVIFAAASGRKGLLMLFLLASIGSAVSPLLITPRISEMQLQGLTHTPEFARMHGISMMVYTSDAALLLLAGLLLPLRKRVHREGAKDAKKGKDLFATDEKSDRHR